MKISHLLIKSIVTVTLSVVINQALAINNNLMLQDNKSPLSLSNQKQKQKQKQNYSKPVQSNYITEDGFSKKLKNDLNNVYFDFDKSNIKPNFAAILDIHAKFLLANPTYRILIEGHADERGTTEYNLILGEKRALAIKNYLLNKGVSVTQLYTVSYGKNKLKYLGKDTASHAKNRRGVIVY